MHELISLWMSWVQDWGYAGVIVLMAMESSIFPVPSEVVIPPAAILSAQEGASMSFWGVVAAGTFGSWLGSAITYAVARIVGRPVIMRWGKFFFMPPHKVEKAEIFLQRYEVSGVFFARLLPVIRHLISTSRRHCPHGLRHFLPGHRARLVCLVHGTRLVRAPHR